MKIYEAKNHILIHAENIAPEKHRHMAAHIIISMDDYITVLADDKEYTCKGILLPAGTAHKIITNGNAVLVFLYDCTTTTAKQIKTKKVISQDICEKVAMDYKIVSKNPSENFYYDFENLCLKMTGIDAVCNDVLDERIKDAKAFIRRNICEKLTCPKVANAVYLSQGRFSHLFKEQIGMTFSAYLIYQRLMYVYTQVIRGESITTAAINAGFSSSAHFADVNRRVFGLSASQITSDFKFEKIQ